MPSPQIKICGLTQPKTAEYCLKHKVNAIGVVFYPPSPRHLSLKSARRICDIVGDRASKVGVFVNPQLGEVMEAVIKCRLSTVQLHGQEPPGLVIRLRQNGVSVIKALFASREPGFELASIYQSDGFLVECGRGKLPGGNARRWDWRSARGLADQYPVLLAGGLKPDNVALAIQKAKPSAVDVSSGVESAPGIKDHSKIKAFIEAVTKSRTEALQSVFRPIGV